MGTGRAALIGAVSAAVAITPNQGFFHGPTSQPSGFAPNFRVSGARITDELVGWSARCRSGRVLTSGTSYSRSVPIVHGGFRVPLGSYASKLSRADYNAPGPVVGSFRVLGDAGQFTSPISATGDWQVSAVLYRSGKRIDSCQSGPVQWQTGTIAAGSPSPAIVPADQLVGGLTYAQWLARAEQWSIRYRHAYHSNSPHTIGCVRAGQQGPVWFMGFDGHDFGTLFTVTCTVPSGYYLLFPYPSVDCSTVKRPPFRASTNAGLVRCARSFKQWVSSTALDGHVISPSGFVVQTPVFPFTMPSRDNWLEVPGKTSGRGAAYGQALMLAPLAAGQHTIVRVERNPSGGVFPLVYRLTVS